MARPKGSKNKKSALTTAQIDAQIAQQQELKAKLEAEQADILAEMGRQKQLMKDNKKALRAAEEAIAAMEEKKQQASAIEAAAAQKEEIERLVTSLISSGKSADEILDFLKK